MIRLLLGFVFLLTARMDAYAQEQSSRVQEFVEQTSTQFEISTQDVTISISPNPATAYTNIDISSPSPAQFKITAFNLIGKEIELIYDALDSQVHVLQDVRDWKPGFYLIQFALNGRVIKTLKLVVK